MPVYPGALPDTLSPLHSDIGRAVVGLAGFANGDDVRVMNAPSGSRFILKALEEIGVIQGSDE
jgi:hypothetical protein